MVHCLYLHFFPKKIKFNISKSPNTFNTPIQVKLIPIARINNSPNANRRFEENGMALRKNTNEEDKLLKY